MRNLNIFFEFSGREYFFDELYCFMFPTRNNPAKDIRSAAEGRVALFVGCRLKSPPPFRPFLNWINTKTA